jgi:hypothetical protein
MIINLQANYTPLRILCSGEEIQMSNIQRKQRLTLKQFFKELKRVFIDMFSNLAYMAP